jgi:hypothetical protein
MYNPCACAVSNTTLLLFTRPLASVNHPLARIATATMKVQALFKKAAAAPKAASKAAKKAVVKPSGSKTTKGWLGGSGGAQNLDKWYGEYHRHRVRN